MANLKSVKFRGGFTVNLENFESAVIQAEVELEAEEGETAEEVFSKARDLVDAEIGEQMKSLKRLAGVKNKSTGRILDVVKGD